MKKFFLISFLLINLFAQARNIHAGRGHKYDLKAAIEMAGAGDTIYLHKGTYRLGPVTITKPIVLLGVDQPVLDGENKYEILQLTGKNIVVKGITFKNSGYSSMNDFASIKIIEGENIVIENNIITNAYFGIHVANSFDCIIRNNKLTAIAKTEQTSGNGIHLWKCNNIIIEENEVTGHRDGIYFEFVTHSYIIDNRSAKNVRYGLHFMFSNNDSYIRNTFTENGAGVAVMFSHHVLMEGNNFIYNWGANAYGLLLKEISDAVIANNSFEKNTAAIMMEGTNRIAIQRNHFQSNGWALRVQASCNDNYISFNNFFGNSFDVATNGTVMLNHFTYNYWDKYEGYDRNRDGFGDIPYRPVSLYAMIIEQNPTSLMFMRSFTVSLLDKAEKALPVLTPVDLMDEQPLIKSLKK